MEQHPYLWLWSSEFSKHVSGLSRCDQCLSVFSQLCSFNWRQAGEYVNEGWHSLLHDNSRSNSRLASQTILTVKFKLKSEASQATCGLFQFLQLLQVLQLLSREMSSLQTSENKIIYRSNLCVLIKILSISQKMTCRITRIIIMFACIYLNYDAYSSL